MADTYNPAVKRAETLEDLIKVLLTGLVWIFSLKSFENRLENSLLRFVCECFHCSRLVPHKMQPLKMSRRGRTFF